MRNHLEKTRPQILERGIVRAERLLERGAQASLVISRWRMVIFIIAFLVCWNFYRSGWFQVGNIALVGFALLFFTVAYYHTRLEDGLRRLKLWQSIKQSNLARIWLEWEKIPDSGILSSASHPYAIDLDLLGVHSLLRVVDSTITSGGQKILASWLLNQNHKPLKVDDWQNRQALIKELSKLSSLRDRMALEAKLLGVGAIKNESIGALVEKPFKFPRLIPTFIAASALCVLTLALIVAWGVWGLSNYWIVSFGVYALLYLLIAGSINPVFGRALLLYDELRKLEFVIRRLERRSFHNTPFLKSLCHPLIASPSRPSKEIQRLARICNGLSVKGHPLIHLGVNALVPWDLGWIFSLQRACTRLQSTLPNWLDCLETLDAAASLGGFAYLNPTYTWPVLKPVHVDSSLVGLMAKSLGHPLIPINQRVANHVELHSCGRILLVTGSNMSGKSTFLRTVGLNVCLAQAGAPVCAELFEWSWMRLYCCIRVKDSLEEGLSYFYAEVKRLKEVLDAARNYTQPPVLFMIDEIYKGTNNRERLLGSLALIRELISGNGLGLISTHDLDLVGLERELDSVTNLHFQETVEGGKMLFDFRLRPGPCPTTNAIRIMEKEGLPVPEIQE